MRFSFIIVHKIRLISFVLIAVIMAGCMEPAQHRKKADEAAYNIIKYKQIENMGQPELFSLARPSDLLRRRLLTDQGLQFPDETSLGSDKLPHIEHWPDPEYLKAHPDNKSPRPFVDVKLMKISLIDALQIGARNSFAYQSEKEDIFRTALRLDLEMNDFRSIFAQQFQSIISSDSTGNKTVSDLRNSSTTSAGKKLETGAVFATDLAVDLVNLLSSGGSSASGVSLDTSISIPLLRGSGKHIVREPLTQAERDVAYEIFDFDEFKRAFAVDIAKEYFDVLRKLDQITNARANYISQKKTALQAKDLEENGNLSAFEVNQAKQNELNARDRWVSAKQSYESSLDSFKILLGLPTDARIELDGTELEYVVGNELKKLVHSNRNNLVDGSDTLTAEVRDTATDAKQTDISITLRNLIKRSGILTAEEEDTVTDTKQTYSSDDPNNLDKPGYMNKGPLEMPSHEAIDLAFKNRLDLRVAQGKVYDAQRKVVVAADDLRAELTLLGSASSGGRTSSPGADNAKLRGDKIDAFALLTLDLPIERTEERDNYRNSLINMEQILRNKNLLEDQIKLEIRNDLRELLQARESVQIQAKSVEVAKIRIESTKEFWSLGRAVVRDILEAQDSQLAAKNSLTSAVISYRIAELSLQRDMGLLKVGADGKWQEFSQ
ncbi:MAG: TolC family protein [Phycisphaerae bacterium]|nr:TolC family protein [Phycisphaerae bacterium]